MNSIDMHYFLEGLVTSGSIQSYNIYCDESCHLKNDHFQYMVLGAIKCEKNNKKRIIREIRDLKIKHGMNPHCEIKWKKVSNNKLAFYKDLINYFFDNPLLSFRAIIVDKTKIDHKRFNQTHDIFYYKVYYQLLSRIIVPGAKNFIYLDIKDTRSAIKVKKLHECLANGIYDWNLSWVKNVQTINSKESELLQIVDILIGAISYLNRYSSKDNYSYSKLELIKLIQDKSSYSLTKSTLLSEDKFNLFFMELQS